ncbi:DNA fragmentation factor subunit beta [Chrysoperla carnea]|uniref:DNA fragmentation factor subunit beta n=1 Tax=Chrysoperla carnea TaxID=189513 RepID=UPI001D08DAA9|nr:DNA fragmentation factor subunit beta [Chrysoperla carnea]
MLKFFSTMGDKPLKGYKITDSERKQKIGIAAKSLDDLKDKTLKKLKTNYGNSPVPKNIYFQLVDGTIVDTEQYFQTLPSQTTLVWVEEGKVAETDAERLYKTIREVNIEYITAGTKVQDFVMNELKSKIYKLADNFNKNDQHDKILLSSRLEHPDWFEGLDTRSKTKEEYLFRRSQDRIRNYYYKTKDELNNVNSKEINNLLSFLSKELKNVNYFGCYFDRRHFTIGDTNLKCLCDKNGYFYCEGKWNKAKCESIPKHVINPYDSRESRILFQTWNLDHVVERSRSIIPKIITNKEDHINFQKVFNDLFTKHNLKLVHIVCHDKQRHLKDISDYSITKNDDQELHLK